SFGVPYNYSQIAYPEAPIPDMLDALCASIERALGFRPNNCLLNFYADGESSMGFHSDTSVGLAPDTGVAIVSLGAQWSIVFRNKADKAIEIDVPLPHGSLLHMPDSMQALWLHAIPKTPGARARISVTFRKIA
ncbi:MAG: alpha-ketoglutarate-dependent dioxygenase AlkB, partial [Pseudomonadota bacterium]